MSCENNDGKCWWWWWWCISHSQHENVRAAIATWLRKFIFTYSSNIYLMQLLCLRAQVCCNCTHTRIHATCISWYYLCNTCIVYIYIYILYNTWHLSLQHCCVAYAWVNAAAAATSQSTNLCCAHHTATTNPVSSYHWHATSVFSSNVAYLIRGVAVVMPLTYPFSLLF